MMTRLRRRVRKHSGTRAGRLCVESLEERALLATFSVTSTGDSGPGSLRQAILDVDADANDAASNPDLISFNIPGAGVQEIQPLSALPAISKPAVLDATTQPGYAGKPLIELNGALAGAGVDGLVISGDNTTVRGFIINGFQRAPYDLITQPINIDPHGNGLYLLGGNSIIRGNYIGTDATGTSRVANENDGVAIASPGNTIGGVSAADRNIISGNGYQGISVGAGSQGYFLLPVATATNNLIEGNFIGTDVTGTQSVANLGDGINVESPNNTIGGTQPGAGNIVSGNNTPSVPHFGGGRWGIEIDTYQVWSPFLDHVLQASFGGSNCVVQGNFVGTDVTGTKPLANALGGVVAGCAHDVIGGAAPGARNLIVSGDLAGFANSAGPALVLGGYPAGPGIIAQGNYLGSDITGTKVLGSGGVGIPVYTPDSAITSPDPDAPQLGGLSPGEGNLIVGSQLDGVIVGDSAIIEGNWIGTDATGTRNMGNARNGIAFFYGGDGNVDRGATFTLIRGNTIAFNGQDGIFEDSGTPPPSNPDIGMYSNSFVGNSIHDNGALGIDLGRTLSAKGDIIGNGPTPNHVGGPITGPNMYQNYPVLTSATIAQDQKSTAISGTLNGAANTTYSVELFDNDRADPSGYGEGQTLLADLNVTTDGSGNATIGYTVPSALTPGHFITATATDPNGNTSEFSKAQRVVTFNRADLGITGSITPSPDGVNHPFQVTLTVTNTGPDPATGVTVTDTLPAGVTNVSVQAQGTYTISNNTVTVNLGNVPVGTPTNILITATPTSPGSQANTATVAGNETDLNSANDTATQPLFISGADVALTMTASPNPVLAGAHLSYTIHVTNNGPDIATNINVTDTLPAGVTFVGASASQGTTAQLNGTVTANLGTLAAGGTATLTIVVAPTADGSLTNSASVASDLADPNASNNAASVTTTVAPAADLAVSVAPPASPVSLGSNATYTLTVTNNGPSTATGVVLTDSLPQHASYVSATASQGTVTQSGGTVTVQVGTLSSGASATVTLIVLPRVIGKLVNTASVTGQDVDTASSNNSASASTNVEGPTIVEYSVAPPTGQRPEGITAGPEGALWVAESAGGAITRITTSGAVKPFLLPVAPNQTGPSDPFAITVGPDGALWFTAGIGGRPEIGRMTAAGAFTLFPLAQTTIFGFTITTGPDGALWFTEQGKIGRITTAGQLTEYPLPDTSATATEMAVGPDHNLWFTESNGNIGRITTAGQITEFPLPGGVVAGGITTGSDGNLWVTTDHAQVGRVNTTGNVTLFPIPSGTSGAAITLGADHNLWFTEPASSSLGRITPTGQVTEYPTPTAGSGIIRVTAGPDGNVWFTEKFVDRVGKIELSTHRPNVDFDGDNRSDLALFRPTTAQWVILSASGGRLGQFGMPGDIPAPADYDGDGKADYAVYRPSTGQWFILRSTDGPEVVSFGGPTDIPIPGDYDGAGKAEIALFRPSTDQWLILGSGGPRAVQFGAPGLDLPVPADYSGDGKTDLAVYRMSTAQWFIVSSAGPQVISFGAPNLDLPIPGDFGGDGKADVAVYRPTTAQWLILQASGPRAVSFGQPGLDLPVPADYDGDGKTDVAVFRPRSAQWLILGSTTGPAVSSFGAPNLDLPLALPLVFRTAGTLGHRAPSRLAALTATGTGSMGAGGGSQQGTGDRSLSSLDVLVPLGNSPATVAFPTDASPSRAQARTLRAVDAAIDELS